ncbi:hypothetical protein TRVL_03315 [Trypanosoma vivax]|nr:hypothetical protein TRVL_03315 [Trypanosoma vivax]
MPPKKRGHNARGREKLFRNAVQHVHVGIGHSVLGAINMQPAVIHLRSSDGQGEDYAFLIELGEQMLSHSSTDFKRFRLEVFDLCASKALFHLNHRRIAEKLLLCLMRRTDSTEGFEAFAHLSVAFARDMGEKFLQYFECFHQALNSGIFDAKGQFLVDTRRLQVIFAAQAAWCREMRPYWLLEPHRRLVERIIRLYVQQMHDSKEYIRRLASEVLASVCRTTRELLPLVVEVVCGDVIQDFGSFCTSCVITGADEACEVELDGGTKLEEAELLAAPVGDASENGAVEDRAGGGVPALIAALDVGSAGGLKLEMLLQYQREHLMHLPVVDSLCFFVAEVLRGLRGSLNTNFDSFYVLLMHVFKLTQHTQIKSACCSGYEVDEYELVGFTEEESRHFVHAVQWVRAFGEVMSETQEESVGCKEPSEHHADEEVRRRRAVLLNVVRFVGAVAVGTALRTLTEETAAVSARLTDPEVQLDETDTREQFLEEDAQCPPLRLLSATVALLDFSSSHAELLFYLLHAKDCFLLCKASALPTLKEMTSILRGKLECQWQALQQGGDVSSWSTFLHACGSMLGVFTPVLVDSGIASRPHLIKLQKVCAPFCHELVYVCVSALSKFCDTADNSGFCSLVNRLKLREATKTLLLAFVQDTMQKNYALALHQERCGDTNVAEGKSGPRTSSGTHNGRRSVRSSLTPLLYELLYPILRSACNNANVSLLGITQKMGGSSAPGVDHHIDTAHAQAMRDVTHALMLVGVVGDRTINTPVSPLHRLLTRSAPLVSGTSPSANVHDGTLMDDLRLLLLRITEVCAVVQGPDGNPPSVQRAARWAEVLTAALPSCLAVAEAENALSSAPRTPAGSDMPSFAERIRNSLIHVVTAVKYAASGGSASSNILLTASSFSLFAQASSLLLQLTVRYTEQNDCRTGECAGFIRDAVVVLAGGFREHRDALLGDAEVGLLLRGVECILLATLQLFGVDADLYTTGAAAREGDGELRQTPREKHISAMERLHAALDVDTQHALVCTLLLEALASSVRSLRVTALRLLTLFCHPSVPETQRIAGCSSIDPSFFDALLQAELFDPLSSESNLNGIQQALAKLSFSAEAGIIRDPLERVILARSMIGLLHTKFAGAWPVALKIIADLVRCEDTSRRVDGATRASRGGEEAVTNEDADSSVASLLEPLVWGGVVCHYARPIVFGDVVRSTYSPREDGSGVETGESEVALSPDGYGVQVWYRIRLTDVQRHEKGELVSKSFSTSQYTSTSLTWVLLADEEDEVLSWERHYLATVSAANIHGTTAATRATDRAVLAKTFLTGLSDMTHKGASVKTNDGRALLVAELILELSSVRRGEHPNGLRQLKMLDDRLALAMDAYVSVSSSSTRTDVSTRDDIAARHEKLQCMCVGLVSDSNPKLQRASIDLLRRLKAAPFARYHAQLVPFCDTQQNLFHFLAGFHVESDIPRDDRADFIATALIIALPKLIAKVSKEKAKDQAVLRRRVLAFVTHLSGSEEFTAVLDGLVQRLVFERVVPSENVDSSAFCFDERWLEWLRTETHCVRRLERLLKQLLGAMELLGVLMHAVGRGFASFAGTCAYMALNAYLIGCKHVLQLPLEGMSSETCDKGVVEWTHNEERLRRVGNLLNSSVVKGLLQKVRRASSSLVVSLFENFPEELMRALRADVAQTRAQGCSAVSQSLIGRYMYALQLHNSGNVAEVLGGIQQRATTTPLLRLVYAWVASSSTLALIAAFGDTVANMFHQLFASSAIVAATTATTTGRRANTTTPQSLGQQSATLILYEGLRCLASLFSAADEVFDQFGCTTNGTLRAQFIKSHVAHIFTALYRLIIRGASFGDDDGGRTGTAGAGGKRQRLSVMSFSVSMWKELINTVSMLSGHIASDQCEPETSENAEKSDASLGVAAESTEAMLSRLLEMCIAFVAHPACAKDRQTCVAAAVVLETLLPRVRVVDTANHYEPLARLFNVVTNPEARLSLCRTLELMIERMGDSARESGNVADGVKRNGGSFKTQLMAVGRAVGCLNSFADNNTSLERYDFELRFHTLRSLRQFFYSDGDYKTNPVVKQGRLRESVSTGASGKRKLKTTDGQKDLRWERDYCGAQDVTIPINETEAPVLSLDGFLVIATNVSFFLRDPEGTISALAVQLLEAMVRYASRQNARAPGYDMLILERVIRRCFLPSLRRGAVARDTHIRHTHMQAFGALAQHYPKCFPSLALLYSRNVELNFYMNVGHVQHRCRLNALNMLRQQAAQMHPRDLLRVFVPFLLAAVKDFAQGKRELQNLTEGRAKGYCDGVLTTLSAIAATLPWEGYYRVLSVMLMNARENLSLRLPMLQGVVMVLDHFNFLDEGEEGSAAAQLRSRHTGDDLFGDDDDDDDGVGEGDDDEAAAAAAAALKAKRLKYRNVRVVQTMEADVLPQLYEFLSDGTQKGGPPTLSAELRGSAHTITSVRSEMQKADGARQNAAIVQLPVAVSITKIVKRFPPERFSLHAEQLFDEVILRLRTKNDKQRGRARRVLCAMLSETGPGKLAFVIKKLRDHLVHGYQLHVLGFTVVTLLYNLYEPRHAILHSRHRPKRRASSSAALEQGASQASVTSGNKSGLHRAKSEERDEEREEAASRGTKRRSSDKSDHDDGGAVTDGEEEEEEELLRQIAPASVRFDHAYGVSCLTACLEDVMSVLLDDYLGEVGEQKQQVELMSTMKEVKCCLALHGFTLIASHCEATLVIETFVQKVTWLLTPPTDPVIAMENTLRGGARASALLMLNELKTKYSTMSKNATADFAFVQKVRLLATRVAQALMKNATINVEGSFETLLHSLQRHNTVREEKIRAFEAKDGTRRIRGNVHLSIERARVDHRRQLEENFLVAPRPERVDVDFSVHTVLATQQKQKLRAYRGRYGREVKQAAKDFSRDDPTAAVVLDTLDEFLLKYLLSVLKQVLGMKKKRKQTGAAVRLDLLRARKKQKTMQADGSSSVNSGEREEEETHLNEDDGDGEKRLTSESDITSDSDVLDPRGLDDAEGDALDRFTSDAQERDDEHQQSVSGDQEGGLVSRHRPRARRQKQASDLTVSFTRQYHGLLERLVPVVLETLQGEGSDAVVGNALDCILALLSLRPPLESVGTLHSTLYETVASFFERGGVVKQRAMRVAAAIVSHQRFVLSDTLASQLTSLCHAELVERNEFAPMALALFHAILSKHNHVLEVYNLIGVVTELLLHASAKRLMRQRCIAVLARFLTEYRMTPEKFRSHIDLLCRNLDYPESSGRVAILELIAVLIHRLPTAVLRQETPFLLPPLAVSLSSSEFRDVRRKVAPVLQALVRNAGVDVIVPTLALWLEPSQPRNRKTTALQTWAVMIPAIASAYALSGDTACGENEASAASDGNGAADTAVKEFIACCNWSLDPITRAATFDQIGASGANRRADQLSDAARRKAELKGWTYVFFALRCLEAIASVAPDLVWRNVSVTRPLVLFLSDRLILHTHPWVQSASLRLLRMYCVKSVEPKCLYQRDDNWDEVGLINNMKETAEVKGQPLPVPPHAVDGDEFLPYVVAFRQGSPPDTVSRAMMAVGEISGTLRRLLMFIARSDVSNEKYSAHRAIQHPSRADAVGLALYLTRAMAAVCMALLVTSASLRLSEHQDATVRSLISRSFAAVRRQISDLMLSAITHKSVSNVMVRTASLIQYFGGLLVAIPSVRTEAESNKSKRSTVQKESKQPSSHAAVEARWLLGNAIGLPFLHHTVVPSVVVAMQCGRRSETISAMGVRTSVMLREQMEARREDFDALVSLGNSAEVPRSGKRKRNDEGCERLTFDEVLFALTEAVEVVKSAQKDKVTRRDAVKAVRKRSREAQLCARRSEGQRKRGRLE